MREHKQKRILITLLLGLVLLALCLPVNAFAEDTEHSVDYESGISVHTKVPVMSQNSLIKKADVV